MPYCNSRKAKIHMNLYGIVMQTLKQWNHCWYFDIFFSLFLFFGFEVLCFILIVEKNKNKVLKFDMMYFSSGKWSDPGHFLKSQGKFFLSFPCTLFYIFLTSKNYKWDLKKFPGLLHIPLLSYTQYLNNYSGQLINLKHIRNI